MRFAASASSIIYVCVILLLAGCDSLGLPNPWHHDEVPPEVKAAPRLVETTAPLTDNDPWPLLGDVPSKPKDFSPKPVYDHYMNELEYHRAESEAAKKTTLEEAPVIDNQMLPKE